MKYFGYAWEVNGPRCSLLVLATSGSSDQRALNRLNQEESACNKRKLSPCLVLPILPKFYYVKRRFTVTLKYRQMYGVLNVDEIKN
jgi:hypothetical protein